MLICQPVAEVFEAFVNPYIATKFWFTKSSGRLEAGKRVQWEWEMYGVSAPVTVKTIEANKRIVIVWLGYSGLTTRGMDICIPKGWHNVRQYHGGQHRIIQFPAIHEGWPNRSHKPRRYRPK